MKTIQVAGLIALGIALSGCATLIKGTTQSVSVVTPPVEGAQCTLVNSEGTWHLLSPGSVVVHKTRTDIQASCTKDGYEEATAIIPSSFNGVTAGNIIAGGLIGIGVDAASGANFEYPPQFVMPMKAVGASAEVPAVSPVSSSGSPTS